MPTIDNVSPYFPAKMTREADNVNPHIYEKGSERETSTTDYDESYVDDFDQREIFDLIRNINDPEHPLTLEDLRVVEEKNITVNNQENTVHVSFTPTIPHCSMATLIGLSIRVQLLRALPSRFKVTVSVSEGTHASEHAVNKQLADKERVAAALENNNLVQIINQCLSIRVQLLRALPSRFKVTVSVSEGTHASEHAVNKQLADKERVAAALENNNLVQIINQCIAAV